MSQKTIESMKADLEAVDTSAFDSMPKVTRGAADAPAPVGGVTPEQFGAIYPAVRAVLVALSGMWFLPAKFKTILDMLLKYLDAATGKT